MQQAKLKGMTSAGLDQLAINTIRTLIALVPPALVLILGASFVWVFRGFRPR
jgi:hypothetical protein